MKRALLLTVLLAMTGCSASDPDAKGDPGTVSTDTEQVLRNAANLDPSSFSDMSSLADAIDSRIDAEVRNCMSKAGFPQLVKAQEMTVGRQRQGNHDSLRIDPLEMGPYTAEQARSHGMVGSVLLVGSAREPGSVISRDPAYDKALTNCEAQGNKLAGTDTQQLLGQFSDLSNTVRSELLEATDNQIRSLLLKRLECVRDGGYPSLDPADAAASDSFAELLRNIGISPSEIQQEKRSEPAIKAGQVLVVPPAQPARYSPPAAEVDFALAYVRCGEQQRFVEASDRLQSEARSKVLAAHETQIVSLGQALRDAAKAMTH